MNQEDGLRQKGNQSLVPEGRNSIKNRNDIRPVGHIDMDWQEFAAIPDNPRQRNTERHAEKANYLLELQEEHLIVSAGFAPDGRRWKIDGHTRAHLWSKIPGLAPVCRIRVNMYPVSGPEEAGQRYRRHDAIGAVDTTPDTFYGLMRKYGMTPSDPYFVAGRGTNAMRIAAYACGHAYDIESATRHWIKELKEIDEIGVNQRISHTGILAAELIFLKHFPEDAKRFFSAYFGDMGTKEAGSNKRDGVQLLIEYKAAIAGQDSKGTRDKEVMKVAARAFAMFVGGIKGSQIKPEQGIDPMTYVNNPEETIASIRHNRRKGPRKRTLIPHGAPK